MTSPQLEAKDLTCERGERLLFSGLDFSVSAGTLLRIAGPNGTGKTTILRIITGLLTPTGGEILWRGEPIRRLREDYWRELVYIGYLPGVKDDMTVAENLALNCRIAHTIVSHGQILEALERVGMKDFRDDPARCLSSGQRRRAALARLWLSEDHPLWVVDEPFTALDAKGVGELAGLFASHVRAGGIIALTTHQEVPIDCPAVRVELDGGVRLYGEG